MTAAVMTGWAAAWSTEVWIVRTYSEIDSKTKLARGVVILGEQ